MASSKSTKNYFNYIRNWISLELPHSGGGSFISRTEMPPCAKIGFAESTSRIQGAAPEELKNSQCSVSILLSQAVCVRMVLRSATKLQFLAGGSNPYLTDVLTSSISAADCSRASSSGYILERDGKQRQPI